LQRGSSRSETSWESRYPSTLYDTGTGVREEHKLSGAAILAAFNQYDITDGDVNMVRAEISDHEGSTVDHSGHGSSDNLAPGRDV
jgi:hypothetical protein